MIRDIAILGAGPAGAHAALQAARAGCDVVLIDEQPQAGGQLWRAKGPAVISAPATPESRAGDVLRRDLTASGVTLMPRARLWQVQPCEAGWDLRVLCDGRSQPIVARRLILAAGAREHVQPLPGWTLPGVIGLAGATAMMKQDLTPPPGRVVVAGVGPLVLYVAARIRQLGGDVAAVVTPNRRRDWLALLPRLAGRPGLLARGAVWLADLAAGRVPILWGHQLTAVRGDDRVAGALVAPCDGDWRAVGAVSTIAADSICLGHGLIPNTEAAQLLGVRLRHDPPLGGWVPEADGDGRTAVPGLFIAGDGAGVLGAAHAVLHGRQAGRAAAVSLGQQPRGRAHGRAQARAARFGRAVASLSQPRKGLAALATDETVICRCEGLTRAALSAEIASGASSGNAVKSGTRAGMGPCQGRFCQAAIAGLIAAAEGTPVPPTARPPLRPVPLSALAGDFDYADLPIPKPAPL